MLAMAEELQIDKTAEAVSARNCARHLSRVMQSFPRHANSVRAAPMNRWTRIRLWL